MGIFIALCLCLLFMFFLGYKAGQSDGQADGFNRGWLKCSDVRERAAQIRPAWHLVKACNSERFGGRLKIKREQRELARQFRSYIRVPVKPVEWAGETEPLNLGNGPPH